MVSTFVDLYEFLQEYDESSIIPWLKNNWVGKDKQESLLRLFSSLKLIPKINDRYHICRGNYNIQTIEKINTVKDIFYNSVGVAIKLKDKGDSSDLSGINKDDETNIFASTSKNINVENVGKLDIDKILTNFKNYESVGYTLTLGIIIRNLSKFNQMMRNIEKTNKILKDLLEKKDTIIIDWNDLNEAYYQFKYIYSNKSIDELISKNKVPLVLKLHQKLGVVKTIRMKREGNKEILYGHIQRSGKSYIIAGSIIEDSKNRDVCNYLVLTTAPNETVEQYVKVFDCIQLNDFNIVYLYGGNKKPFLKSKNIIICSKQFLQDKQNGSKITKIDKLRVVKKYLLSDGVKPERTYSDDKLDKFIKQYEISDNEIVQNNNCKVIGWLKKMKFDMRFVDESHNGGTTELAKKVLQNYGKGSFTVQITATYSKPINDYDIPEENWILWNLEDIKLCRNIKNINNHNRLIEKHGKEFEKLLDIYSVESIMEEYSKYPDLWLLTDELKPEIVKDIIERTRNNNYGWSTDAVFLLRQNVNMVIAKFQNEKENLKVWYRIFGKKDEYGIYDPEYDTYFMKRIENICKNPDINSRFMDDDNKEPMIIMAFLPQNNIDKISVATKKLLEKHNVIPDYEIVIINSTACGSKSKRTIEEGRIRSRNNKKKGVLVLSGRQCSLGVSIHNCDIVLLLNNNKGFDLITQMMFRCMTEGKDKKCGFVVDLNIHRVIETSINYASIIKPKEHPEVAIRYILQERLVNLNGDHWMSSFNKHNLETLTKSVYEIYSSNTERALKHFLDRLRFKQVLLSSEEQQIFNVMFNSIEPTAQQKEIIEKMIEEEQIKKGIEKQKVIIGNEEEKEEKIDEEVKEEEEKIEEDEKEEEEQKINYMDILKHIIPLVCLLTIHDKETSFIEMFNYIEQNKYVYEILLNQTKSWWCDAIDTKTINAFINVYVKYVENDKETNQIIRTVKELFMKNINNSRELSKLIDKYLIPQEMEKKKNAEVSTPYKLRQEMLDKMPDEFWKTPKKVFEPCSGKGGFLIDIINRFMNGLDIEDDKERYRTIVEECLYWSDINPTNIFICKLLVDPYDEYKLNYNEGDTLKIDIEEKWGVDGFDAVIGNPPYQNTTKNKGTGNTLWNLFVNMSIEKWLVINGYLLFIHPRGWRQIKNKTGNLMRTKQIIYVNMNDVKKGLEYFKCSTDYDYYLLQNVNINKKTIINDYKNEIYEYFINEDVKFIPNHSFNEVFKIIDNNVVDNGFLNNQSSYELRKKWMSNVKSDVYKYPCIYSINSKNIASLKWSSQNDKGHFNVTKFIFSNGSGYIHDLDGTYGLTQWAYAIVCDKKDIKKVEQSFNSNDFLNVIDAIQLTSNKYNYNIIKKFKKDFWKEFIVKTI